MKYFDSLQLRISALKDKRVANSRGLALQLLGLAGGVLCFILIKLFPDLIPVKMRFPLFGLCMLLIPIGILRFKSDVHRVETELRSTAHHEKN